MASAALSVSISALASSIKALMPVWMVWGIELSPSFRGARHAGETMCNFTSENLDRFIFNYLEIPGSRYARPE
jgi:hypothetical protein